MKNYRTYLIAAFIWLAASAQAQSNLTLYHMQSLPQQVYSNPAFTSDSRMFFGFPGLSSVDVNLNSNGLALRQLTEAFVPITGTDSFQLDINRLSNVFDSDIYINSNVNLDLFHFGFNLGNNFFSFNVTEKVKTRVLIPKDAFHLLLEGNGGSNLGRTFRFNLGADVLHSREYAIGYSRSLLNDAVRVGGRVKYIYGLNVLQTNRNDIQFRTNEEDFNYLVKGDIQLNMASSIYSFENEAYTDPWHWLSGSENYGFGLDLGVSADLNDLVTVSASVIDLGQIWWKENTVNYTSKDPNAEFVFKGVDVKRLIQDTIGFEEEMEHMLDSFVSVFDLDTSNASFSTGLFSEFYLGGQFHLNKNHNLGLLLYGSFNNQQLYPAMTLSWNARFRKVGALSISYTMMQQSFVNLGIGYSLNLGAFQTYIVSDNLIGAATAHIKNVSFRMGINFTFGRRKIERAQAAQN